MSAKDGYKRLNIDVPVELANEFKAYAALQGKTQRDLISSFMRRCVRRDRRERIAVKGWVAHSQEALEFYASHGGDDMSLADRETYERMVADTQQAATAHEDTKDP